MILLSRTVGEEGTISVWTHVRTSAENRKGLHSVRTLFNPLTHKLIQRTFFQDFLMSKNDQLLKSESLSLFEDAVILTHIHTHTPPAFNHLLPKGLIIKINFM